MLLDRDFRVETTCPNWWRRLVRAGMALVVLSLSVLTFRPAAVGAGPLHHPAAQTDQKTKQRRRCQRNHTRAQRSGSSTLTESPLHALRCTRATSRFAPSIRRRETPFCSGRPAADGSFLLRADDAKAAVDRKSQIVVMAEGYGPALSTRRSATA